MSFVVGYSTDSLRCCTIDTSVGDWRTLARQNNFSDAGGFFRVKSVWAPSVTRVLDKWGTNMDSLGLELGLVLVLFLFL